SAAAVLMTASASLYFLGAYLGGRMHGLVTRSLMLSREQSLDANLVVPTLAAAAGDALLACAPLFGLIVLAALLAPLALGGWSFSTEARTPQLSRLNPLSGLRGMFALRSLIELGKALAKFGVVALIAVIVLWNDATELMALGREPTVSAIGHAARLS